MRIGPGRRKRRLRPPRRWMDDVEEAMTRKDISHDIWRGG